MDQIDQARELFRMLEARRYEDFGEVARRAFCIQEKLAQKKED